MPVYKAQIVFPHDSGFAEDRVVNTLHFSVLDAADQVVALDDISDAIDDFFYVAAPAPAVVSVAARRSNELQGNIEIAYYNMSEPEPRVPAREFLGVHADPGADGLPSEVALCMSYQGAPESGVAQARKRGRIYIGPLAQTSMTKVGSYWRPSAALITDIAEAGSRLLARAEAAANWNWVVHSAGARNNADQSIPYDERPLLAPLTTPVTEGWVDNAFDTQRRRGSSPSAKTFFTSA